MAIEKNESYWHNASVQSIGVMVFLLLVLPSVIHGSEGRLTGTDQVVLSLAVLPVVAWSGWTVVRLVRRRHRGSEPDRGDFSARRSAAARSNPLGG